MAFNLFKKNKYADKIFTGGVIYTGDPEYPKAEALAVRDGKIIAIGEFEYMDDLNGPNTEIVELLGSFLAAGKTEYVSDSLDETFKNVQPVLTELKLEEEESDSKDEEDEPKRIMTLDYEEALKAFFEVALKKAKRGITSSYVCPKENQFEESYRGILTDCFSEGLVKQRYFGMLNLLSAAPAPAVLYYLNGHRTACQELEGVINSNELCIGFDAEKKYIYQLAEVVADHGYNVRITPSTKEATLKALEIFGDLSASYKKVQFSVVHNFEFTEEELSTVMTGNVVQIKGDTVAAPRLEEGMDADLAVYESDPELGAEEATSTYINGECVYRKGESSAAAWAEQMHSVMANLTEEF